MLKKFMKKRCVLLLVLLLCFNFVLAADEWGDIITGDNISEEVEISRNETLESDVNNSVNIDNEIESTGSNFSDDYGSVNSYGDDDSYTFEFYVALGVGIIGIGIIILLVYLLIRRPKNKW